MQRPALERLLEDAAAGRIDCVLVYKVDRLSRSLLDFARMMEVFERHHLRAARWFWDQAVFDFIGGNLQLAERLSMRDYTLGWELKQAGLDWQDWLLAKWGLSGTRRLVARLKADGLVATQRHNVMRRIVEEAANACGARAGRLRLQLQHLPDHSRFPE